MDFVQQFRSKMAVVDCHPTPNHLRHLVFPFHVVVDLQRCHIGILSPPSNSNSNSKFLLKKIIKIKIKLNFEFKTKKKMNSRVAIRRIERSRCCLDGPASGDICGREDCLWPCPLEPIADDYYRHFNESAGNREKAFFLETSGASTLNFRQACVVESLAYHNPNLTVHLLMTGEKQPMMDTLALWTLNRHYGRNLHITHVNLGFSFSVDNFFIFDWKWMKFWIWKAKLRFYKVHYLEIWFYRNILEKELNFKFKMFFEILLFDYNFFIFDWKLIKLWIWKVESTTYNVHYLEMLFYF